MRSENFQIVASDNYDGQHLIFIKFSQEIRCHYFKDYLVRKLTFPRVKSSRQWQVT
jgi:hypothetical protein